jgi:hypothetical protein
MAMLRVRGEVSRGRRDFLAATTIVSARDRASTEHRSHDARGSTSIAITRIPDLEFELDDVHLGVDCISIRYRNQSGRHVTEMAVFGPDGKVTRGWGLYDAG